MDVLSISVDHYDYSYWDNAKHVPGISKKALETVRIAKALGMKVYGITFLNHSWTPSDIERIVRYVNEELGISFALSYPYISDNQDTFIVGGSLRQTEIQAKQQCLRNLVAHVLKMKLRGSDVATVSGYMKDALRTHDGKPMKYPCTAGQTAITIDCNLNVFPCYKKQRLFNLRDRQDLNLPATDNSVCDNKYCLINCFKEASLASRHSVFSAVTEEFFSNPKFYLKIFAPKN